MMKTMDDFHDGIVGIEAHGKVTGSDYESILIPTIEKALQTHKKLRFLYCMAPDFTGFTGGALWDDARVGLKHFRAWDRVAVVTDVHWLAEAVKLLGFVLPVSMRVYKNDDIQEAKDWLLHD